MTKRVNKEVILLACTAVGDPEYMFKPDDDGFDVRCISAIQAIQWWLAFNNILVRMRESCSPQDWDDAGLNPDLELMAHTVGIVQNNSQTMTLVFTDWELVEDH